MPADAAEDCSRPGYAAGFLWPSVGKRTSRHRNELRHAFRASCALGSSSGTRARRRSTGNSRQP
jgi:hypothetical protein